MIDIKELAINHDAMLYEAETPQIYFMTESELKSIADEYLAMSSNEPIGFQFMDADEWYMGANEYRAKALKDGIKIRDIYLANPINQRLQTERDTAKSLFEKMAAGLEAEYQCEESIAKILDIELVGISFDSYDKSMEIYPELNDELNITDAQVTAIFALGCMRFWINYPNGTDQYAAFDYKLTKRAEKKYNRWNDFNNSIVKFNYCKHQVVKKAMQAIIEDEDITTLENMVEAYMSCQSSANRGLSQQLEGMCMALETLINTGVLK